MTVAERVRAWEREHVAARRFIQAAACVIRRAASRFEQRR
jgi:hypothetical protein